jgi:transcriptional regulator with XRE-family HTH domain
MSKLGQRLKETRKKAGLLQEQLADKLGWHDRGQARISQYERGRREPTLKDIERIATALGVTVSWLAFGEGPRRRENPTSVDDDALGEALSGLPLQQEERSQALRLLRQWFGMPPTLRDYILLKVAEVCRYSEGLSNFMRRRLQQPLDETDRQELEDDIRRKSLL